MNIEREEALNYPTQNIQEYYSDEEPVGFSDFQAFANQENQEEEQQQQEYQNEIPEQQYEKETFYQEELSEYQIKSRKSNALAELRKFQNDGIPISPHFNMNTDLFELEQEVDIIKANIKRQSTLEMSRFFLLCGVGFVESATTYYDPHSSLIGWKKSMQMSISSFDDVLMAVYERYGYDITNMNPLIVLTFLITMNAVTHVMSKGSELPQFTNAINNLKADNVGPSEEAMDLFNQLNTESTVKPAKRKYNKKK